MTRRYTVRVGRENGDNRAILRLRDGREIHYWAPMDGGYVREESGSRHGTFGTQVCDGLAYRGPTLRWTGDFTLAELIRDEARSRAGSARINDMLDYPE